MSLSSPIIVVAEFPASELVNALTTAGAFPVVECTADEAQSAFASVQPAAVILDGSGLAPELIGTLGEQIATHDGPMVPVIAWAEAGAVPLLPDALPMDSAVPVDRLIARLRFALRVRTLHATVLRRMETFAGESGITPALSDGDPLHEASVLVAGRGRSYPSLSVAVGERVGLIGALSVETAARHLNARDLDGVVVGDGFSHRMVEAFLTALAEDVRYRDLPVGMVGPYPPEFDQYLLPNLDRLHGSASQMVEQLLPLVRLHAFQARLRRMLASLDAQGLIDPESGLLTIDAFWRDLTRAVDDAKQRGAGLSMVQFCFETPLERRSSLDAARLVSRLARNVDFACREADGSILAVFTETDLRAAHVIARRIASVLKHTMLTADRTQISPAITLATLKSTDTIDTLIARVVGGRAVAAE